MVSYSEMSGSNWWNKCLSFMIYVMTLIGDWLIQRDINAISLNDATDVYT